MERGPSLAVSAGQLWFLRHSERHTDEDARPAGPEARLGRLSQSGPQGRLAETSHEGRGECDLSHTTSPRKVDLISSCLPVPALKG